MNLVLWTKQSSGGPRPLWLEVSIDSAYLNSIKIVADTVVNKRGEHRVLGASGGWQRRWGFNHYRLEAVCEKYKIRFRLVNPETKTSVESKSICIHVLAELHGKSEPKKRVFYTDDQPVLMAVYYSTNKSQSSVQCFRTEIDRSRKQRREECVS